MIKFDDEMLSRLLTAHACGGLKRYGNYKIPGYPGCLYQIACDIDSFTDFNTELKWDNSTDGPKMSWFDAHYNPTWTMEQFVQYLANKGIG